MAFSSQFCMHEYIYCKAERDIASYKNSPPVYHFSDGSPKRMGTLHRQGFVGRSRLL